MAGIGGKTAFVFSGGGSLGAIQVGMLRVLLTYGLKPDFVVGASVGATNASYFASAPDAECVARLEQIWSGLRRADIFPFTFTSAFGLIRHRGYIVDPSKLRRLIETNLPCSRIEDAEIPLHIMRRLSRASAFAFRAVPRSMRFWRARRFQAFFPL